MTGAGQIIRASPTQTTRPRPRSCGRLAGWARSARSTHPCSGGSCRTTTGCSGSTTTTAAVRRAVRESRDGHQAYEPQRFLRDRLSRRPFTLLIERMGRCTRTVEISRESATENSASRSFQTAHLQGVVSGANERGLNLRLRRTNSPVWPLTYYHIPLDRWSVNGPKLVYDRLSYRSAALSSLVSGRGRIS